MRANIFILALMLLAACGPLTDRNNALTLPPSLPGDYVIEMTDTFAVPLYKRQFLNVADKEAARDSLVDKIKQYALHHSINLPDSAFYTELGVGFASPLTAVQHANLISDVLNVALVVPDFIVRSTDPVEQRDPIQQKRDPIQQSEWDLKPTTPGDFNTCAIDMAGGSKKVDASNTRKIFILDTGVDDHGNIVLSRDSSRRYIDTEGPPMAKWRDRSGHGTVVAGIAASKQITYNDSTVMPPRRITISAGVSAGACVVSYKVLDSLGNGKWRYLRQALDDVARVGVAGDVVNMSLGAYCMTGCSGVRQALQSKIVLLASKGIFVVMAAGNDSGDANMMLPGSINGTNVFTVGSIDCNQNCTFYSNIGTCVDYVAVGTNVFSTYRKRRYLILSGTSMSTAVVSGIIHSRGSAPVGVPALGCPGAPVARRCATPAQCQ